MFLGNLNISGLVSSLLAPFAAHSLVIQQLETTLKTEDILKKMEKNWNGALTVGNKK